MKKIKLGDVLDVKRGASLSGEYYSEEGDYIRLTLGNFDYPGGGFKKNTSKSDLYFTGAVKKEFILRKGDIITPLTEQVSGLLGETATIPDDNLYIQSGDIGLVIPDDSKIDKRFAYYLVSSPVVKKQLDAAAQQTKIRHTSPDAIKACEAWIPEEIPEQAKIAKLLDEINVAITNNNSMCSDLEAMAKLLFDYWFVQFDFPDENGKPYKSIGGKMVWNEELKREIPEGWEVKPLKTVCTFENGDRSSNYPSGDDFIEKGIPFVAGGALQQRNIDYNDVRYISEEKYKSLRAGKASKWDLLMTLRGSLAKCVYSPFEKAAIASALVIVRPHNNEISNVFLYRMLTSDYFVQLLKNFDNGSVQANLSVDVVGTFPVVIPSKRVLEHFSTIVGEYEQLIMTSDEENQQLLSLRDFLLPMLMNGQVKVSSNQKSKQGDIETDLSQIESMTVTDQDGKEVMQFTRPDLDTDSLKYQEIKLIDAAGQLIQGALPTAQQLYTIKQLTDMAPNGLFTTSVDPGMLTLCKNSKGYLTMIQGSDGRIQRNVPFERISGLSTHNPIMLVNIGIQAMAMISGRYYLKHIHSQLNSIESKIDHIWENMKEKDFTDLQTYIERIEQLYHHKTATNDDTRELRDISTEVSRIYKKYKHDYFEEKVRAQYFYPTTYGSAKVLSDYQAQIERYSFNTTICMMAYWIRVQAKLVEIAIKLRMNPYDQEIEDLKNDAVQLVEDTFDSEISSHPVSAFDWIAKKAESDAYAYSSIFDTVKSIFNGSLFSTDNNLLIPLKAIAKNLSVGAENLLNLDNVKCFLNELGQPKKIIIIPENNGSEERLFMACDE